MTCVTRLLLATALAMGLCACRAKPVPELLYVSAEQSGEIVVVDPAKAAVVTRIKVGKRPRGLRLSHDGKFLFVALSGSPRGGPGVDESTLPPADRSADGIGVVDLDHHALVRTLPAGQDPESFDLSRDGKRLFVSNEETAALSVVDIESGKVIKRIPVGKEPEGVSVNPDGTFVYVTSEADGIVSVVDATKLVAVDKFQVGERPRSVVFTRDGKGAFVTNETSGTASWVDAKNHRLVASLALTLTTGAPQRPMGSALSPDGKHVYVSNGRGGMVAVINVDGLELERVIPDVGARPWGIGVSPDGQRVYTANGPSDDVAIIDVARAKVRSRVKVGGQPWGLVVAPTRTD